MASLKAMIIVPFSGAPQLPVDLDLDYVRDESEPIGGGFAAVVDGLFGYGVAIIKTQQAQIDTLTADPDTLAVLVLTNTDEGGKWPELDNPATTEGLARINDVLTANSAPNLPAGITIRQTLAVMAPGVDFDSFDVG